MCKKVKIEVILTERKQQVVREEDEQGGNTKNITEDVTQKHKNQIHLSKSPKS